MNGVRRLLNAASAAASLSTEQPQGNSQFSNGGDPEAKPTSPASAQSSPQFSNKILNSPQQGSSRSPYHTRNPSLASSLSGSVTGGKLHRPTTSTSSSSTHKSSSNIPPLPSRKRSNAPDSNSINDLNTKDKLLMSLLASEAALDSRSFTILDSETVEELKKEEEILESRLQATRKKLNLETKIRDAATSLARANSASGRKGPRQNDEQLEAANKRFSTAQQEYWRVSERANDVHRRLLEHRAGVLSLSVRSMDQKSQSVNGSGASHDSGYSTPSNGILNSKTPLSPTSSLASSGATQISPFDGAHFFAGHVDAIVPVSTADLQAKLKRATEALAESTKKQATMARDLSILKLEKEQMETSMEMERQSAQEVIDGLEKEMPRLAEMEGELGQLRKERESWRRERQQLEGRQAGAEVIHEKDAEIAELRRTLEQERKEWEEERADMEDSKMEDLAQLQEEMDRLRDEDSNALQQLRGEMDDALSSLQTLMRTHSIVQATTIHASSLGSLVQSIDSHLEVNLSSVARERQEWEALKRKLEDDVRSGWDKREALSRDVEEARREREDARREARALEIQLKDISDNESRSPASPSSTLLPPLDASLSNPGGEASVQKYTLMLQPLWTVLPSPEARAAKFSKNFRTGSPTPPSPSLERPVKSLSDLDVRSLKSLYDNTSTNGRAHPPSSPINSSPFSIEAFVVRVQALLADDKALIERLVRFAQAHDLLKKNAERAQKLAQESQIALETYQKQVRTLEERNMALGTQQAGIQDEIALLQETVDRLATEKREIESQAAEKAEAVRQLTEANNTLSAKTLSLAADAVDASNIEKLKKSLEAQLAESKTKLDAAQKEIDDMRNNEQLQRIQLLDELNTLQTDNGQLRAQLRALKK